MKKFSKVWYAGAMLIRVALLSLTVFIFQRSSAVFLIDDFSDAPSSVTTDSPSVRPAVETPSSVALWGKRINQTFINSGSSSTSTVGGNWKTTGSWSGSVSGVMYYGSYLYTATPGIPFPVYPVSVVRNLESTTKIDVYLEKAAIGSLGLNINYNPNDGSSPPTRTTKFVIPILAPISTPTILSFDLKSLGQVTSGALPRMDQVQTITFISNVNSPIGTNETVVNKIVAVPEPSSFVVFGSMLLIGKRLSKRRGQA